MQATFKERPWPFVQKIEYVDHEITDHHVVASLWRDGAKSDCRSGDEGAVIIGEVQHGLQPVA